MSNNRTKPDGSVGPTARTKSDGNISKLVVSSHEKDRNKGQIGVRYITEDLIKKLSGQEHLEITTTLNLNLAREGGKIKYIENLEKLKKLKVLNLSGNAIEKIEKLDKLTNLQELNLSYNCLTKIENLEPLSGLQVLNLTGNQIQHVPLWLTKKLKGLRVFSIAKNQLESIDEISKLQSLSNLVQLSVAGNPISDLPHCRLLIVFHLRTLQMLDGQEVTSKERKDADQRFAQEEVERLRRELEALQQEKRQLVELNNQSTENESELVRRQKTMEQERQMLEQDLKEREQELQTTVQLLQKKTSDLTRTSMKQYQLEQELAFYKIDHKFESLSHPQPDTPESMSMEEGSAGESPYIGKGRFRPNEIAHESFINSKPIVAKHGQVNSWPNKGSAGATSGQTPAEGSHGEDFTGMTLEQAKAIELMNRELEEKQRAIKSAENHLQRVRSELERTELDLGQASKEQQRLRSTENEKQIVRENLIEKSKNISRLQKEAESIDAAMRIAKEEIFDKESELKQFYNHLKQMSATDKQNYSAFEKEAGSKEEQLNQAQLRYRHLQRQLEQRLAAMKQETENIKHLEQELRSGHVGQNEELKQELESIVRGLSSYLHGVRQMADAQNLELSGLMRDRSELVQKLKDLEEERLIILRKANRDTAYLKQQLADMEESLRERQSINESLKQQLNESQARDVVDAAENSGHLQEANAMIDKLKKTIAALQTEKQAEKETLEKRLHADGKRMSQLRQKIREADIKDGENRNLHRELTELQTANARLQDQLYAAQEKLRQQKQTSVDPEALRRRLEEVTKAIQASKGRNEKAPSRKADDPLEQVIGNLEENVHREMEKKSAELDKAQRAKEKIESKVVELRDEIIQVQELERSRAEQAIQAVVDNERMDQENLLAEIHLLQDELARERANRERQSTNTRRERKSTGQSTATSGSGSGSSTGTIETGTSSTGKTSSAATSGSSASSSTSSSVWSAKKREIYDTMTNDEKALFDELQREIEELRNLLATNAKGAASKAEAAREKTNRLKDMVNRRYLSVGTSAVGSYSSSARQSSASSVTSESEDFQKALDELDDVQAKVEACREKLIKESRERNRLHGSNQDGRSQLYEILDDQRKEIDHLSRALDDEIRQKNYMAQQYSAAPHPTVLSIPPNLLHNVSQPALDAKPSRLLQPGHFGSSFNPNPHLQPHETTVPPIQQAVNSNFVPNDGYGGVYPSVVHPQHQHPSSSEPGPAYYPAQSFVPGPSAFAGSGHPLVSRGQTGIPAGHQQLTTGSPEYGQGVGIHPQNLAPSGTGQPLLHGFAPNQPLQAGAVAMPTQGVVFLTGQPVFAPTTPVAGAGFAHPYMVTPGATTGQPLMMSTPSTLPNTAIPLASPKRQSVFMGSNRNGGAREEHVDGLLCNVPEHHDLEDHISKLQHKIRSLQIRLREEAEELSFREKESRHVAFEDDSRVSRAAVLRLESELENRRIEIEGLDLAVERQKTFFKDLKEEENSILAKREAIKREFESLRRGQAERRNFQSFLEATSPIPIMPPDHYSDFDMREFGSQKNYLVSELKCAEQTLSTRRSELADIEHHIAQCKADYIDAQNELKAVKSEFLSTVEAQKDVEHCTHDAGILLLDAESKVKDTHLEIERLEEQKNQLKAIVRDIEDVIRAKDEEFQILELKIEQATHCLETLQKDFADDSNITVTKEQEILELMNQEIVAKRQDLEALLVEIKKQRSLLELVNTQVDGDLDSKRQEIQVIGKQLETLRSEKRHLSDEIETKENRLQSICVQTESEQMALKRLLSSKAEQNSKLRDIEDELRRLRSDIAESQLTLLDVKEQLRHRGAELEDVKSQLEAKQAEVARLVSKREELSKESERLRSENQKRASELERLRQLMDREKKEYETCEADKRDLENGVSRLKWEKESMEEEEKKLSAHVTDLNKVHKETQRAVQDQQQKLLRLNKELTKIEEAFDDAKQQHSILNGELHGLRSQIEGGQSELMEVSNHFRNTEECVKGLAEERDKLLRKREELETDVRRLNVKAEELKQAVQEMTYELGQVTAKVQGQICELEQGRVEIQSLKEAERRHINEVGFSSLEDRVKNLGKEISRRDKEIEQQRMALMQSKQDHEHKQKLLATEMEALREKSAKRMSDLEAAARAQYARANRLVDEMSYQRAEYLEPKRQFDTRKELAEREANLVDALTSLKSDLQFGVTENILDLERARRSMVTEEEKSFNKTKEKVEYYINNLTERLNLHVIRAQNSSSVTESSGLGNSLSELDILKAKQDSIKKANFGSIEQLQKESCNEEKLKLIELERIMEHAEEISRQTDSAKLAQLQATRTSADAPEEDSHPLNEDANDV